LEEVIHGQPWLVLVNIALVERNTSSSNFLTNCCAFDACPSNISTCSIFSLSIRRLNQRLHEDCFIFELSARNTQVLASEAITLRRTKPFSAQEAIVMVAALIDDELGEVR